MAATPEVKLFGKWSFDDIEVLAGDLAAQRGPPPRPPGAPLMGPAAPHRSTTSRWRTTLL
jgi:hypothetical protein